MLARCTRSFRKHSSCTVVLPAERGQHDLGNCQNALLFPEHSVPLSGGVERVLCARQPLGGWAGDGAGEGCSCWMYLLLQRNPVFAALASGSQARRSPSRDVTGAHISVDDSRRGGPLCVVLVSR